MCATVVPHDLSMSMIQSSLALANPFAIEVTTAITVCTSVMTSLSLFSTSTPNPPLMNVIPNPSWAHSHRGASSPCEWALPPADTRDMSPPSPHSRRWDMPLDKCAARSRPSNQRRPSLFWCLLQYLKQQVTEGLRDASVTRRRQVEEVKHVLWDDGSVRVDELPAHIQELSLLA